MNKLLPIVAALSIAGCSAFMSRAYDPVEYNYAVLIAANSTHAVSRCESRNGEYDEYDEYNVYLQKINSDTFTLMEYVANKSDSEQALIAATQVREITQDFLANTNYSHRFCQHKLSNIQASARMLARGVGSTDRFDICKGNVQERFALFEASYKQNKITKEEFVDLSNDLLKMGQINTAGCSYESRTKLENTLHLIEFAIKYL